MSHILKEISPKKFVLLSSDKEACTCPYRSSVPQKIAPQHEGDIERVGFTGQNCGTVCPLFQIMKPRSDQHSVMLHCVNVPHEIEVDVVNISNIAKVMP